MGFFGTFTFSGGTWVDGTASGDAYLCVEIHDSDIATVRFEPAPSGATGCFYLGTHPRDYFEDPPAGVDVDAEREAAAFCAWAERTVGSRPDPDEIASLIAREGVDDEPTFVFVEAAVRALLTQVGIPPPPRLPTG